MIAYGMLCWSCCYFGFHGNFFWRLGLVSIVVWDCWTCVWQNAQVFVLWFFFANSFVVFLEQVWNAQMFVLRFICNRPFVLCLKEFSYKKLQKAMVWYIVLFLSSFTLFSLFMNYYNLRVVLYDSLQNVMLGLPLFWILWEFFFEGWGWLV